MTYESASSGPGEQFRLSRIRPDVPRANMVSPTTHYSAPMWDVPQPRHFRLPRFETSIIAVSAICIALSIYGYISLSDVSTTAYLAFLASFPLIVVLGFFIHLDRHEPEPLWTKIVAFVWGAGVAIVGASMLNSALLLNATLVLGDEMEAMRWTAVYVAPPVEETLKALGVLFIILARRSTIHSLIDGIVYAGFSGAGFAFIENIQYFLQASQEGSAALTVTVILRGVFSPFLHPIHIIHRPCSRFCADSPTLLATPYHRQPSGIKHRNVRSRIVELCGNLRSYQFYYQLSLCRDSTVRRLDDCADLDFTTRIEDRS